MKLVQVQESLSLCVFEFTDQRLGESLQFTLLILSLFVDKQLSLMFAEQSSANISQLNNSMSQ